jgi:hypothetical protein
MDHGAVIRKLRHFDSIFNGIARFGQIVLLVFEGDGNNIKIDIVSQAAIQDNFLTAIISTLFQSGEIEKFQVDRFFDLINIIAC